MSKRSKKILFAVLALVDTLFLVVSVFAWILF